MSADGIGSAPHADASVRPDDRSRDTAAAGGGKGQHDAPVRQPVETRTRREHADAMLAGSLVRSQETSVRGVVPNRETRQAERTSPDHAARPGREVGKPGERRAETRTRHEHADGMLAGATKNSGSKRDIGEPGDQHSRLAGHSSPDRGSGARPDRVGVGELGRVDRGRQAETHGYGTDGVVHSLDGARADSAWLSGTGRPGDGKPGAVSQEAGVRDRDRAAGGLGAADSATTAHVGNKSLPSRDGEAGQRARVASEAFQPHGGGRQDGHLERIPARPDREPPRQDVGDTWALPQAGRDRARALYQQGFGDQSTARNASAGRDRGTNVAGAKPDKSPGDTNDLPPTGEKLLEMEDDKNESRLDKFRNKIYREVGDVVDAAKDQAETVQNLLERPPPSGHPEVAVNSRPMIGPDVPQHATVDAGSMAEVGLVLGVLGFQMGRWVHHKVDALRR